MGASGEGALSELKGEGSVCGTSSRYFRTLPNARLLVCLYYDKIYFLVFPACSQVMNMLPGPVFPWSDLHSGGRGVRSRSRQAPPPRAVVTGLRVFLGETRHQNHSLTRVRASLPRAIRNHFSVRASHSCLKEGPTVLRTGAGR